MAITYLLMLPIARYPECCNQLLGLCDFRRRILDDGMVEQFVGLHASSLRLRFDRNVQPLGYRTSPCRSVGVCDIARAPRRLSAVDRPPVGTAVEIERENPNAFLDTP
jgi:hypothetical protein